MSMAGWSYTDDTDLPLHGADRALVTGVSRRFKSSTVSVGLLRAGGSDGHRT